MTGGVVSPPTGGKLYVADADPDHRSEIHGFLSGHLPDGWAIADELAGAAAILTVNVDIDADMIASAGESLRVIGTIGPSVADPGSPRVAVRTFPPNSILCRQTVAEFTVMLMLSLVHNLSSITRDTAEHRWVAGRDKPVRTDQRTITYNWIGAEDSGFLYGKVVGIVGLGAIGQAVARILATFGARVRYTQRHRRDAAYERELGVEWRTYDDLLRQSDIVTLHHRFEDGPGGADGPTFGEREFSLMKPTSFLVNTARGGLVDEDAMIAALKTQQIAGVGLDVFLYEPLPTDHPLLSLAGDRVLLCPHIAAGSLNKYWQLVASDLLT